MRPLNIMLWLVLMLPRIYGDESAQPPPSEVEELRLVIRSLRMEITRLRDRNADMSAEVIRLRRLLQESTASENTGSLEEIVDPVAPLAAALPGVDIRYVNPHWHYVILEGGTDEGITEGAQGRVMRDGVEIGVATVTAVKASESVADLRLESFQDSGNYPRAGDRILFLPSP